MYTTNSGIMLASLTQLADTLSGILNQYGDMPIYTMDDTLGKLSNEIELCCITVKPGTEIGEEVLPLRLVMG